MGVYWVSDVRFVRPWVAVMAGLRGLGFRMCGCCAPAEGDRHIFPLGFLRMGAGWLGWMLVGWGGKMSQSPGIIADGRPLGLGCSRCASPGWR